MNNFIIDELKEFVILKNRKMSKDSPLTTDEARQLRGLAAKLNWTSIQTCPDMSFGAFEVITSIKDAQIGEDAQSLHCHKMFRITARQWKLQWEQ